MAALSDMYRQGRSDKLSRTTHLNGRTPKPSLGHAGAASRLVTCKGNERLATLQLLVSRASKLSRWTRHIYRSIGNSKDQECTKHSNILKRIKRSESRKVRISLSAAVKPPPHHIRYERTECAMLSPDHLPSPPIRASPGSSTSHPGTTSRIRQALLRVPHSGDLAAFAWDH